MCACACECVFVCVCACVRSKDQFSPATVHIEIIISIGLNQAFQNSFCSKNDLSFPPFSSCGNDLVYENDPFVH